MLAAPLQGVTGNGSKLVKPSGTEMTPLLRIDGGEDVLFSQFHHSPDIILGVDNYGASPDLVFGMDGGQQVPQVVRGGPPTGRRALITPGASTSNPEASLLDKTVPVGTENTYVQNGNSQMVHVEIHQSHSDLLTFDENDVAGSFVNGGR